MYGTSKFQVTAKTNGEIRQASLQGTDRHQVSQCLGWMLMTAITGIDHRDRRVAGSNHGCSLLGMAHGTDICKAGDHADRIGNTFTLRGRRGTGIGKSDHTAAKVQHGRFKA